MGAKLGEDYERLWVVKQVLRVLADKVKSVEWEPPGQGGRGIDVWVTLPDGRIELHQCKTRTARWLMSDLAGRKIFKYLKDRLEENPKARYVFVSPQSVEPWKDLIQSARYSDNSGNFLKEVKGSLQRSKAFDKFCKGCCISYENEDDLQTAWDLLQRTEILQFQGTKTSVQDIWELAERYVVGEPDGVVSGLMFWMQYRYRQVTNFDDIEEFLRQKGYALRNLSQDSRVPPKVACLRERFHNRLVPNVGEPIPQHTIQEALDALDTTRVVLLRGDQWNSKSVLSDLSRGLEQRGWSYLPIRLDTSRDLRPDVDTLGKAVGLPAAPAHCLRAVTKESQRGVLILDELAALPWSSFEILREAIHQVLRLVKESNGSCDLRVVVASCRSPREFLVGEQSQEMHVVVVDGLGSLESVVQYIEKQLEENYKEKREKILGAVRKVLAADEYEEGRTSWIAEESYWLAAYLFRSRRLDALIEASKVMQDGDFLRKAAPFFWIDAEKVAPLTEVALSKERPRKQTGLVAQVRATFEHYVCRASNDPDNKWQYRHIKGDVIDPSGALEQLSEEVIQAVYGDSPSRNDAEMSAPIVVTLPEHMAEMDIELLEQLARKFTSLTFLVRLKQEAKYLNWARHVRNLILLPAPDPKEEKCVHKRLHEALEKLRKAG